MLPEGLSFTVCWLIDGEFCPVLDYLEDLKYADQDCFYSVIDGIEKLQESRYLRPPTVRSLKGNNVKGLLELKVLGGNSRHYARIPLMYTKIREVILLFGETKKQKQPTQKFINRAIAYRDKINRKEVSYEQIPIEEIKRSAEQ